MKLVCAVKTSTVGFFAGSIFTVVYKQQNKTIKGFHYLPYSNLTSYFHRVDILVSETELEDCVPVLPHLDTVSLLKHQSIIKAALSSTILIILNVKISKQTCVFRRDLYSRFL